MRKGYIFILIWTCLVSVCSCGGGSGLDAKFDEIDRLCDSIPEAAIDSLASINQDGLSEKDINRYRLLWIKSRDKAYVTHKSDTLILDVIDYYDKHRSEGLYAEALYYGGRVYSDIGDLPKALEFFQKSLDEIPEDDERLRFKSTVLNQTGRLLHNLRLDSEAIEYLEKSLQIDSIVGANTSDIAYTHGLIASSMRRQNKFMLARIHINEAVRISSVMDMEERQTFLYDYAYMLYREGKIDSALNVVRQLIPSLDSITIPFCLAVASQIYKDAGIPDTAYMYARLLTRLKTPNNKQIGYKVIFSDELKGYVSSDTLNKLMPQYKQVVEDYLNQHEAEHAIIQNSRFNYSKHVREKEIAQKELSSLKDRILVLFVVSIMITFVVLCSRLIRKYKKANKIVRTLEAVTLTEMLKQKTTQNVQEETNNKNKFLNPVAEFPYAKDETPEILNNLKERLQALKDMKVQVLVDKRILESNVYKELRKKLNNGKCILDSEDILDRLEENIESLSNGFQYNLNVLTKGGITPSERKIVLLTKCGFTPAEISRLLSRKPNTISSQRASLAKKIQIDRDCLDGIIISL